MGQKGHYTNIASEFHVISCLTRKGHDVNLTLGNNKKVDIVVALPNGKFVTIDVKAVAGKMDWLIGNTEPARGHNHFFILVTYNGEFEELTEIPQCWIIPSRELKPPFLKTAGNNKTRYVGRKYLMEHGKNWYNKWDLLKIH